MSDSSFSRQSDLAIMDANEYKQKRRLQRILDTHDNVEEVASQAREDYIAGEITRHGRNITIFTAVCRYVREVHNLLYESADGLNNITYERILDEAQPIGRIEFESKDDKVIWSLQDYYRADEMYTETFTDPADSRHGPDIEQIETKQYTVPIEASWRAYVLVNHYLGQKQGIQIQMKELEVDEHADPF